MQSKKQTFDVSKIEKRQTRIWGMSFGLIGDLVMALPLLTYFEKKYPGSYKIWGISRTCSFVAPTYLNHPLIDRIKVTDGWAGMGQSDLELRSTCDVIANYDNGKNNHSSPDWYNKLSCVEETAYTCFGITDLRDVLTPEEMKPRLHRWFDVGFENPECHTYTRENKTVFEGFENNIAIWPFATAEYNVVGGRSPSPGWWSRLIEKLTNGGYTVYHYGRDVEPALSESPGYRKFTHLSYFRQVKASLASRLVLGTDSGSQWVMGAYQHPAINLITDFLPGHSSNFLALNPINDNAVTFFSKGGCDNIPVEKVLENIKQRINS